MNVEREIAGFALPFTAGVFVTAYTGAIFCGQSSFIHFSALMVIFITVLLLWKRKAFNYAAYIQWASISVLALSCGALSAATAISLFDLPESGLEVFCSKVGLEMQRLIDGIQFKSKDTSALIKALLTGERGGLSSEIKSAFRDSGASHILALSGLHLGIIYGILLKVFSIFGNSRHIMIARSLVIIAICGIYTISTGAGDSLVRALIFISLREIAKISCRYRGLGQILLISLIIQLIIDPLAIRSVSFQLSYAAMTGIAFIYPRLEGFWNRAAAFFKSGRNEETDKDDEHGIWDAKIKSRICRAARWIWNTVALSIACQITTAPLAYMYFSTFPLYFMLTNLLTLPLTGLLIPAALLTVTLSTIGYCPEILINATEALVCLLIWLLEVISTM